jgi:hypothetical protein
MAFSEHSKHAGLRWAELVRKKKVSPAELVEYSRRCIKEYDCRIHNNITE